MIFRTHLRDCLCLNWALPAAALPPPPEPLRYDVFSGTGDSVVFASALLYRQDGLRTDSVPLPQINAPQLQLHLCTLDPDGVPSVLILAVMVPGWLAPGARWVTRQPARAARLVYPDSIEGSTDWRWEVRRGEQFVVGASLSAPPPGSGPKLGSWDETVAYFRRRGVGFSESLRGLRRVEIRREKSPVTPVKALVEDDRLLLRCLRGVELEELPSPHSAWLCGPMSVSYELSGAERSPVGSRLPAPG